MTRGVAEVAGVGDGAGEPVELGHYQGVAGADGGQGLGEPGSFAVGAGESLVEVDAVVGDAEAGKDFALGGEVLSDGRASDVADEFSEPATVPFSPPVIGQFRGLPI